MLCTTVRTLNLSPSRIGGTTPYNFRASCWWHRSIWYPAAEKKEGGKLLIYELRIYKRYIVRSSPSLPLLVRDLKCSQFRDRSVLRWYPSSRSIVERSRRNSITREDREVGMVTRATGGWSNLRKNHSCGFEREINFRQRITRVIRRPW